MATRTEAFNSISTRIRNLFMASSSFDFLSVKPYTPPSWASHLHPLPSHIFSLAHVCIFILLNQLSIPFNIVNWWNQLPLISLLLLFSVISYQLPTPIHRWNLPNLPTNTEVWLKVNEFIPSFLVIWIDSFIALLCFADGDGDFAAWRPLWNAIEWEQSQEIGVLDGRCDCARCWLCHYNRRHPKQPLSCHCRCC